MLTAAQTAAHSPVSVQSDPLGYDVPLPFSATYYPMGYAVNVSAGSEDVLRVAEKLWSRYPKLSDAPPVRLRIIRGASSDAAPPPSIPRAQAHLLSIVHGPDDFAIADLSSGFAFGILSPAALADHSYLRYHFLEPLVYVMQAAQHFVFVHASCVALHGSGVLLCGDSGAGKTCLAYSCAKLGWDFVSGDAVHILRDRSDGTVVGRPYQIRFRASAKQLFPELRRFAGESRSNGKMDLEIDTDELGIGTALRQTVRHIVFVERFESGEPARLAPFPRHRAIERLRQTICFGDEQTRESQMSALDRFVHMPVWRLSYSDSAAAERILRSLIESEANAGN